MADKDDAIRKVRAMLAQAESTTFPEEAKTFEEKVIALRLRHGISDADLQAAEDEDDDFEFFGVKMFWYSSRITPLTKEMRGMLDKVMAKLAKENLGTRTETLVRFRDDVRDIVQRIERERDALIKELYEAHLAEWTKEGYEADDVHAHEMAISSTKFHTRDMRSDTIERIVGRSRKALLKKEMERLMAEEKSEESLGG